MINLELRTGKTTSSRAEICPLRGASCIQKTSPIQTSEDLKAYGQFFQNAAWRFSKRWWWEHDIMKPPKRARM